MIVSTMISGHRTLALLAEALEEEQAAEKADLFLDVSLFCADGDAMAGRLCGAVNSVSFTAPA